MSKTERIRDPIHDLIAFDRSDQIDSAALLLIAQPEFQRLRRIKQLGVSEFVYPSATHTRFSHSIGVFHNARRLMDIIKREIEKRRVDGEFKPDRAKTVLMASLLHDIGHGPFSHAFEEARKSLLIPSEKAKLKKHEAYTADMIESPHSEIRNILDQIGVDASEVATLLRAENPGDMYHGIISSSFDADRLDYLQRDRYMTGTGAGAIDLVWLLDNVRVAEIDMAPPGDENGSPIYTHSFCIGYKARDAAEDFLLSRYRLYSNVYFHKTTRGFEQLISAFFRELSSGVKNGVKFNAIEADHCLIKFFSDGGETLQNYLALDDVSVLGAIQRFSLSNDGFITDLARRIVNRERPICLDIQNCFPVDLESQRRLKHSLNEQFKDKLNKSIFYDVAKLSIYGEIGADDSRAQKRLMIQLPGTGRGLKEITDFSDATIVPSSRHRVFERYYFLDVEDFKKAGALKDAINGRAK